MTGIGNNFGPKSAMGMNNAQNLKNLQKTDKSGQVGEPQEASINPDRPEGDTEVDKTVIINERSDGTMTYKFDGVDNDVVIWLKDGQFDGLFHDKQWHDIVKEDPDINQDPV